MTVAKNFKIVVAEPFDEQAIARLSQIGTVTQLQDAAPQTLLAAVPGAHAILVRSKAHITAKIIEGARDLLVIGRASPNCDHIDLRAASRRNISVVYTPHVAVTASAEFTFTLMLTLQRRILFLDRQIRDGKFETLRAPAVREFSSLIVGILGVDPVSQKLSEMTAALGADIIYHDPGEKSLNAPSAVAVDFDKLLAECDILSIHLPITPQTRGIISADALAKMKPTAMLVNTSRGQLIDTRALAESLKKRQLAGAALDVFEVEPLPANHPIRSAPNCILTPHVAGVTLDATAERYAVAEDVIRVLQGAAPRYPAEPAI